MPPIASTFTLPVWLELDTCLLFEAPTTTALFLLLFAKGPVVPVLV